MDTALKSLRDWREEHGITLEELADVTGYSIGMLSRVERGQRRLSALARIHFARTLGVKVREIFPAGEVRDEEIESVTVSA